MGMLSRSKKYAAFKADLADKIAEEDLESERCWCGADGHYDDGDGKYICERHFLNGARPHGIGERSQAGKDAAKDGHPADPDDTVEHDERWDGQS